MAIENAWRLLTTVHAFDLVVRQYLSGAPLHQARGLISVDARSKVIVWRERGEWVAGPLTGIRFSNTTRWEQTGPAEISVSHQRRGPEPLFLSTLRASDAGAWTGDPHQCGADRYRPVLVPAVDHLSLAWDVESPTDSYRWEMLARPE